MDSSRLYELIDQVGFLLRSEQRKTGLELGLQPVHYQMLGYLNRCNRFSNTPAAATRYLGLTKGTVSQSLQLLENKGLIEKVADIKDRRVVHLLLTGDGLKTLFAGEQSEIWQQACSNYSEQALKQTASDLEGLLRSLQLANQSRTFGICRTCRHLQEDSGQYRCGLTEENLSISDTGLICHEHEFPKAA
ncbi:MAG: MarR family transcriptional regulator [Zetaproteobacteria bacterium CG_4_9_14_3_um_filter_53_7]|nr:MAG: MarR family transcriptional regulator [Zetaproteobacteria bacterium CG_4_9_14_3_um_filter_53_7]